MPTTEGGLDFKIDITHAIDGCPGIEHNLPITPICSDVVELFEESQTTNSPTLPVSYGGPFGENRYYVTENPHDDEKLNVFAPAGLHGRADAGSAAAGIRKRWAEPESGQIIRPVSRLHGEAARAGNVPRAGRSPFGAP